MRELGLPREALLNVIVRGEQAIPPRGSTRVEAGDRLHVLVRQEVAIEFRELLAALARGPDRAAGAIEPAAAAQLDRRRAARGATTTATPGARSMVDGIEVVDQLRTRRDRPGALVALADGRYAFTGPVVAVGPTPAAPGHRAAPAAAGEERRRAGVVA